MDTTSALLFFFLPQRASQACVYFGARTRIFRALLLLLTVHMFVIVSGGGMLTI